MLNFFAKPFAIAGIIAAAGPILIHLLNRRRYRVVNWAAMDFLKEALQRNRKILQMRDLILLILRVACVCLVGMALARPFFQTSSGESLFQQTWPWLVGAAALGLAIWAVLSSVKLTKIATGLGCLALMGLACYGFYDILQSRAAGGNESLSQQHPVHAVLVLDNSLSMGYETLEGSLLTQAKTKAEKFIEQLPPGSSVSVIPLCGSKTAFTLDAYRSKDSARDALSNIEVVDRKGTAALAMQLAIQACEKAPELPSKRVVFLSDQQVSNWPTGALKSELGKLPELQIVKVGAKEPENVWISDFQIEDGIADIEMPSLFSVTVESNGPEKLQDVQVALSVDGVSVASQTIDMEPKQTRQLQFQYQIDVPAQPGRPQFINAAAEVQTASIEGDRLKFDNKRHLVVPVVAALPVVFIDQLGSREDTENGEVGETYPLRRYHAPVMSRDQFQRQLIQVRHIRMEELTQEILEDARLVVIGGVESPGDSVPLLREYIKQGGQLIITAGAEFNPAMWNQLAWKDGEGILPAPLDPKPFGNAVKEWEFSGGDASDLKSFALDFNTMRHPYFVVQGTPEEELEKFYRLSFFFKAVRADVSSKMLADLKKREESRQTQERDFLAQADKRKAEFETMQRNGTFGPKEEDQLAEDETQRKRVAPNWLLWRPAGADRYLTRPLARTVQASLPRVLARFDVRTEGEQLPCMVERRIGLGKVVLFTSGTHSDWNTLAKNKNLALFDRIPRRLIEDTLPKRNFESHEPIVMPVEPDNRLRYTLTRPQGSEETVSVSAREEGGYGLTVPLAYSRGAYQITPKNTNSEEAGLPGAKGAPPVIRFAVNGPNEESNLSLLNREDLEERLGTPGENGMWRWIGEGDTISLEGAQIRGREFWKTIILMVLAGLILEMIVLAWPAVKQDMQQTSQIASGNDSPEHAKEPAA